MFEDLGFQDGVFQELKITVINYTYHNKYTMSTQSLPTKILPNITALSTQKSRHRIQKNVVSSLKIIILEKDKIFSYISCSQYQSTVPAIQMFSDWFKSENSQKSRHRIQKNVVSPLKIIIFEKVIIYEIAASSWYRWYLSC